MRVNTDFHLKAEVARYFQVEKKLDIVAICMLCIGHVGQVCVSLNTQFLYSSCVTLRISHCFCFKRSDTLSFHIINFVLLILRIVGEQQKPRGSACE